MAEVTRCSCWHKNFIPKGLSAPAPGLYICIKSWKKLYKIRLQRDFFETCSKWPKWQEVSVDIKILSPGIVFPWPVANIHLSNHEMMCIKSEVEEILFKLVTNDHSDEAFLLTSKFWPKWLSAPAQGLCLNFFSSITTDFNIFSALRRAIQDQWSSGQHFYIYYLK